MMRRLVKEGELLASDRLEDLTPSNSRWQYIWSIARVDLMESILTLLDSYGAGAVSTLAFVKMLHIIQLVLVRV